MSAGASTEGGEDYQSCVAGVKVGLSHMHLAEGFNVIAHRHDQIVDQMTATTTHGPESWFARPKGGIMGKYPSMSG